MRLGALQGDTIAIPGKKKKVSHYSKLLYRDSSLSFCQAKRLKKWDVCDVWTISRKYISEIQNAGEEQTRRDNVNITTIPSDRVQFFSSSLIGKAMRQLISI